ncbi:MAG: ATP-binding protein [Tepidisphaeraceae bacterium]
MQSLVDHNTLHRRPAYLRSVRSADGARQFDAIAHAANDYVVLELEPTDDNARRPGEVLADVQAALASFREPGELDDLFDGIAKQIRRLTGFHRVMVYRFDADWNGQVVAEAKEPDLEPFLGLHYPASDIPRQARELYTKNWLRFIADRDYTPSPLVPPALPSGRPLDMSFGVLRSVSPIHLEYLRNMGVGASMSISLVHRGRLWGLVACHHYTPRRVPYEVRTACELLAQVLSLQAIEREQAETDADTRQARNAVGRLILRMDAGEHFADSLAEAGDDLLAVFRAGGAAVVDDRYVARVGQAPNEARVLEIVDHLSTTTDADDVFSTDHFSATFPFTHSADAIASGVLAIRPTRLGRRWILWFRGEQVRTVDWAGDPNKSVTKGEDARLSPRGSFALWKQTLRGRSLPWSAAEHAAAEELRRQMLGKTLAHAEDLARKNVLLRRVNDERAQALDSERAARNEAERLNHMKDQFVATLSHELRTPLTAIQGWAHLLRSTSQSPEGIAEGLEIIERNARAQGQMVEDLLDISRITAGKLSLDVQPVQLPSVVEAAVAAVQIAASAKDIRIHKLLDPMSGVSVTGDPHRLQQVLWNLLNNAIKFTPKGGKVTVILRRTGSYIELSVSDTGVGIPPDFLPHVFDRFRQADASYARNFGGLGLGLAIVRNLIELHGGTVSVVSPGENQGTTFTITLPVRAIATAKNDHPRHDGAGGLLNCDNLNLNGLNVLVIDDEPDTRELVCRVLRECNVQVTSAGSVEDAIQSLRQKAVDIIISDIGMPGEDGYSLIRRARELEAERQRPRTPAIALTAYARAQDRQRILLAGFQMHLAKPVEAAELLATVASLAGRV